MSGKRLVPIMVVLILVITVASIITFQNQKHAFDYPTLCEENLRSLGMALFAYQEKFGSLPPAWLEGPSNQPAHSWRVLLLPFLKEKGADDLAAVYRWDEPWDSPHNKRLLDDFMPAAYHCPSQQRAKWVFKNTHFVAPVGPSTAWPGSQPGKIDRATKQILLIEYKAEDIPWTSPKDPKIAQWTSGTVGDSNTGVGSPHGLSPLVLYADGSVERLAPATSLADLKNQCETTVSPPPSPTAQP
jgi:hypothetical protein